LQGRPCARASKTLAQGLKLKGDSKFEKKEKKTCTYGQNPSLNVIFL